jgi:predicted 2-oxoglutarate/Fe(II)-dependent dioxygenase YbiX/peroxiredoxin
MDRLRWGEPAPWFIGPTSSRPDYSFSSVAGRYVVIAFVTSSRSPAGKALIGLVDANRRLFDDSRCAFFGVTADPVDQAQVRIRDNIPGVRWFFDADAAIARKYGAIDAHAKVDPCWYVLDPLLRVMASGPVDGSNRLIDVMSRLPPLDLHAGCQTFAPVLLVPRIFEPSLCEALIDFYKRRGGEPSGFMVERDGKTQPASDPDVKRRADCIIDDEQLRTACQVRIRRRLVPEIAKVFQFTATRMERYIVACYRGDEAGHFRPHRDNTTKGTAHRRFAVTLNLNSEAYSGGELRFPEFGSAAYTAPTGGAVVFSCSLLHEALPVTQGVRYAFLPFLYDDAAAALRERNNAYLDASVGEYREAESRK